MKAAQSSSNFENKKIPAYSLLPYAENIAWQLWFVVQFCFLFNSSLKFKSPISLLDSTIKKSWLIKCSQAKSSEDFEKNALFKFQFFYYGSWQIWKPLNRVQTSKIKKFQPTLYCLWLKTLRDNYDLLYNCFLFNSFLKIKSSISILDSTTKNSDWSSAHRQSHLRTLKKIALFKFQFVYYGSWQMCKLLNSSNFENIKNSSGLLPYAENIAWQIWFVLQFCFLFNSSLKFKSPVSLLDSTIKKSWLIKCSQAKSSEDFEKNALLKFQFFYYGSWQIWKPLNRVQTSKIKKFQRTLYCLWLKTLRDNYDLLYNFVSYSTLPWNLRAPFLF